MSWISSYFFGGGTTEGDAATEGSTTTRLGDDDIVDGAGRSTGYSKGMVGRRAEMKEEVDSENDLPLDAEDREAEIEWRARHKPSKAKTEDVSASGNFSEFRSLNHGSTLGTAIGELYKFEVKREEFRPLLSAVKLVVIQDINDAYYANLQFRKNDGSDAMLLECMVANELEIQFDFAAHTMRFNLFREDERGGMDILSFFFRDRASEEHVSRIIAVKLFETNHRCMFSDLLKKGSVRDSDERFLRDSLDTRTGTVSKSEAAALALADAEAEDEEYEDDYHYYGDAMADVEYIDTKEFDSDVDMQDCTELFSRMKTSVSDRSEDDRETESESDDYLDLESDEFREYKKKSSSKKKTKGVSLDQPKYGYSGDTYQHTDITNENLDIIGSKNFNRVFVTRKIGRSGLGFDGVSGMIEADSGARIDDGDLDDCGSGVVKSAAATRDGGIHEQALMGYFRHTTDGALEYNGKLRLCDQKGKDFIPYKMCGYRAGHEMLILTENDASKVHVLNLDRGEVVDTWDMSKQDANMFSHDSGLEHLTPIQKHSDAIDLPQVYGITGKSLVRLDGRLKDRERITEEKVYSDKTKTDFESMGTSEHGFVAVGSLDGKIRMYDSINKRAKVCLPGIGECVKNVEVSSDSKWILATCQSTILVFSTVVRDDKRETGYRTGFEGRGISKKDRIKPIILRLKEKDRIRIGVRKVEFTPAKFNESKDTGGLGAEKWIVSSVDQFVIKWNFTALIKKGRVNDYSIRKASDRIVKGQFRFGIDDDLLVSEKDNVYAQHSSK